MTFPSSQQAGTQINLAACSRVLKQRFVLKIHLTFFVCFDSSVTYHFSKKGGWNPGTFTNTSIPTCCLTGQNLHIETEQLDLFKIHLKIHCLVLLCFFFFNEHSKHQNITNFKRTFVKNNIIYIWQIVVVRGENQQTVDQAQY